MVHKYIIEKIARELKVPGGCIYAIVAVESGGQFDYGNGKIPILYERHICYRELVRSVGRLAAYTSSTLHPDICNPRPGGYGKSAEQYKRLAKSIYYFGDNIAHLSCSFGAFQIMGFNHNFCGYQSAKEMSDAYHAEPEANQVRGFVNFLKRYKKGKVVQALRVKNWKRVALLYNGPAYKKNKYDSKLEKSYREY